MVVELSDLSGVTPDLNPALLFEGEFPDQLVILEQGGGKHVVWVNDDGIHGLACFRKTESAEFFARVQGVGGSAADTTFNEARELAKCKGSPIDCLMLMDTDNAPLIHWVR